MMEIQIGDVFSNYIISFGVIKTLFKVIRLQKNTAHCRVYCNDRFAGVTLEHKNTLLKMKKLSSLEKELM